MSYQGFNIRKLSGIKQLPITVNDIETALNLGFQFSIQYRNAIFGVFNNDEPIRFLHSGAIYIQNPSFLSLSSEDMQDRKYIFIPPNAELRDIFWLNIGLSDAFGYLKVSSSLTPNIVMLRTQYAHSREFPYLLGYQGNVYMVTTVLETYTSGYEGFDRVKTNWES